MVIAGAPRFDPGPRRRRRGDLTRALAGAMVLAGPLAPPPAAAAAGPRLVVPEPIHDAGPLVPGDPVRHAFLLRNEGDRPLAIVSVRPTCGCTVARHPERLEPGATGSIEAELDTTALGEGPFQKTIAVATSDPGQPAIVLTLRGEVRSALRVVPGRIRFPGARAGEASEPVRLWIEATASTELDFEILAVEAPGPWIETGFRRAAPEERAAGAAGAAWIVTARLTAAAPTGRLAGEILVRTSHPRQPRIAIPLSGLVAAAAAPAAAAPPPPEP